MQKKFAPFRQRDAVKHVCLVKDDLSMFRESGFENVNLHEASFVGGSVKL